MRKFQPVYELVDRCSVPVRGTEFYIRHHVQTPTEVHPASYRWLGNAAQG